MKDINKLADKHRSMMLEAERYIWKNILLMWMALTQKETGSVIIKKTVRQRYSCKKT